MKQEFDSIDYGWLTRFTGDPFVDIGGFVIKELERRFPKKGILELINDVTRIYVYDWDSKINPFFLNSKVTHHSLNPSQKIEGVKKYFQEIVNCEDGQIGYCRITGRKTELFVARRDNSILSGSNTFVNFHHGFEQGLMVSKEVLIRCYFVPLGCVYLQGRIALIHSNTELLTELFAKNNCSQNLRALGENVSKGVLKSNYKSPATALFRFIDDILTKSEMECDDKDYSLVLYHFTNFAASPDLKMYRLPATVFRFYAFTRKEIIRESWDQFVASNYINSDYKGVLYDRATNSLKYEKKDEIVQFEEEEFKCWTNRVYSRLLDNLSILPLLMKWSEKYVISLDIVKVYQLNIRNMKEAAYKKIMELADFVVNNNDERMVKKHIQRLKQARYSSDISRFLVNEIIPQNMALNNPVIITVEEHCEYLFPDDGYWRDVRDVLLVAIYQKLHEKNIQIVIENDEIDNEL